MSLKRSLVRFAPSWARRAGLRSLLIATWREFNEDQLISLAAGVAFFCVLALFPAMAAVVSLYGLFADVQTASAQLRLLSGVLPPGVGLLIGEEMLRLASTHETELTFRFLAGLAVSTWSASAGMRTLMGALNVVYEAEEKRGFFKIRLMSLMFTACAFVFVLATLLGVLAAPAVLRAFGIPMQDLSAPDILRWPVLFALVSLALSALYRLGPGERREPWRWFSPGSVLASLTWLAMSMGFSAYVSNFAHYDRTYGSLAAVIGLMVWLWLSIAVFLAGAEFNAEIHKLNPRPASGPARGARASNGRSEEMGTDDTQ